MNTNFKKRVTETRTVQGKVTKVVVTVEVVTDGDDMHDSQTEEAFDKARERAQKSVRGMTKSIRDSVGKMMDDMDSAIEDMFGK